jgi:hypothetical protein
MNFKTAMNKVCGIDETFEDGGYEVQWYEEKTDTIEYDYFNGGYVEPAEWKCKTSDSKTAKYKRYKKEALELMKGNE